MLKTVCLKTNTALVVLLGLLSCAQQKAAPTLPYYNTPDFTPHFITTATNVTDSITHRIADFSFVNQHGQLVTQAQVKGKLHVANFFFTSCGSICPAMMRNMQLVRKAFANDSNVVILSYSVAPWIDSVAKLNQYAQTAGFEAPYWHLLTGSKAAIYTLARQSYFAEEDLGFSKDSTDFLHTEHFILVDKQQRIRGIYNGTLQLEAEQLIKDIEALKNDE